MFSKFYSAMVEAQAKFDADPLSLDALRDLESAEALYNAWVAARRAEWDEIPASGRKDSAEENANETEGCRDDRLRWYEIALGSYELTP